MTESRKRLTVLLLAVLLLVTLTARRTVWRLRPRPGSVPQLTVPRPSEVGTRMPEFMLRDVSGREASSEEFRGKVLLVDFWATWCEPCKVEMPAFEELQNRYRDRGLVVVGIALDTDAAGIAQFAKKLGVHYILLISTPEVERQFGGILGIPTTFLVDRNGVIRKKVIGFDHKEAFEKALTDLL